MLNLKKLNLALCLSVFLISSAALAAEAKSNKTDAVDILTIIGVKNETTREYRDALLGCTTTPGVCAQLAGRYGYPYYYAEVDYSLCNYNYPYACYGIN